MFPGQERKIKSFPLDQKKLTNWLLAMRTPERELACRLFGKTRDLARSRRNGKEEIFPMNVKKN